MTFWPSTKQWKSWSLPTKLTAIGTLVGLVSLGLYVLDKGLYIANVGTSEAEVEAIVRRVAQEYRDELKSKYPEAHTVFGITRDGFVVPKGLIPESIKVFWDTGKVHNISSNAVRIMLPDMVLYEGMRISGIITDLVRGVGAKSGRLISIGGISPRLEIIGIQGDLIVVALGFEAKKQAQQ